MPSMVPGFVLDTRLEPGARLVTFRNGAVVRETIVAIDEEARRLVWSAAGGRATHYNSAVQALLSPVASASPACSPDGES